jgi:hypothetical protein
MRRFDDSLVPRFHSSSGIVTQKVPIRARGMSLMTHLVCIPARGATFVTHYSHIVGLQRSYGNENSHIDNPRHPLDYLSSMPAKRHKRSITNPAEACWLLGDETRWKMVRILLTGPQAVRHLALAVGKKRELVSKHMQQLRILGLVQRSDKKSSDARFEFFELVPDWRVDGDPLMLDFGECQVRFGPRETLQPVAPAERKRSALPKRI